MIEKKHLDKAMEIILDFHLNKSGNVTITPKYLHVHGLPEKVNADEVVSVLCGLGCISYDKYSQKGIVLENAGRCYFENKSEKEKSERRQFIHDWKVAIFSVLGGALLSKPVWDIIQFVVALFRQE